MKNVWFFLFLVLIGCGKKFDTIDDVEPIFTKTNNPAEFLEAATEYFVLEKINKYPTQGYQISALESGKAYDIMDAIPINFYNIEQLYKGKNFVAVCRSSSKSRKKEILVDEKYWNQNKNYPDIRKALIIHELGHCNSLFQHRGGRMTCNSIMEETLITDYELKKRLYYSQEFFDKNKRCP